MNKIMRSNSGFTLAEVLVALAILGLFIFPISGLFVSSLKANQNAGVEDQVDAIANKTLETMIADGIYTSCVDQDLSNTEYDLYQIDKTEYQVKKTIVVTDKVFMDNQIPSIDQTDGKKLLTIDASLDGQISFPNSAIPTISYISSAEETTKVIYFDDITADNEMHINDDFIYYVNVIGGSSKLKLVLVNGLNTAKILYLSNIPDDGYFSVNTVMSGRGPWQIYNNVDDVQKINAGSIAIADIKIDVKHIPSGRDYSVSTSRVYYKYQ